MFTPVGELLDHPPQDVDPDTLADMPAALAARPWHPRLRVPVPVPVMNVHTDDEHPTPFVDFLGVAPQVAVRCARERLCGICGTDLDEELAFLGTVESVHQHVFSDPPLGCDSVIWPRGDGVIWPRPGPTRRGGVTG